jgi:hypothetical protein
MIFCPPQEGKSHPHRLLVSAVAFGRRPVLSDRDRQSYNQQKALRWGKWLRRMIEANPQLGIELPLGSRAADRFETTAGGKVISVGIEGGITGESVDC